MTNDKKYRTAVVVPAYRHLSDDEKISMRQCVDVLGGHDIIVIHPERLDLTEDLQPWQSVVVKALRNEWFDGVKGYNSMLLSTEFYDLFSAYDYILIYQLDAYVFRNELDEWVAKGYDYIGAPWIIKRGLSYYLFGGWMQALHRKLHPIGEGENMVHAHLAFSVGNGGLSLRRVSKMREMAEQFADEISRLRFGEERRAAEDVFFSLVAGHRCGLKKPGWREALAFAWESKPDYCMHTIGKLPFGCHAWSLPRYKSFWKQYIK